MKTVDVVAVVLTSCPRKPKQSFKEHVQQDGGRPRLRTKAKCRHLDQAPVPRPSLDGKSTWPVPSSPGLNPLS
jgi:hypothetical protein